MQSCVSDDGSSSVHEEKSTNKEMLAQGDRFVCATSGYASVVKEAGQLLVFSFPQTGGNDAE